MVGQLKDERDFKLLSNRILLPKRAAIPRSESRPSGFTQTFWQKLAQHSIQTGENAAWAYKC